MNSTFDIESVRNFTSRGKFTLIAGSSWEADEDIYIPWLNAHRTSTQAIIAPHEFDAPRLKVLLDKFKGEAMLLSEYEKLSEKSTENIRAIIVDSFGKLSSIYRYGDIAYRLRRRRLRQRLRQRKRQRKRLWRRRRRRKRQKPLKHQTKQKRSKEEMEK